MEKRIDNASVKRPKIGAKNKKVPLFSKEPNDVIVALLLDGMNLFWYTTHTGPNNPAKKNRIDADSVKVITVSEMDSTAYEKAMP